MLKSLDLVEGANWRSSFDGVLVTYSSGRTPITFVPALFAATIHKGVSGSDTPARGHFLSLDPSTSTMLQRIPLLHRAHPRQEAGRSGWAEEGRWPIAASKIYSAARRVQAGMSGCSILEQLPATTLE